MAQTVESIGADFDDHLRASRRAKGRPTWAIGRSFDSKARRLAEGRAEAL